MRDYELVFVVSPEVPDENLGATTEKVSQFISNRGGSIDKMEPWGRRKLAYPINDFREGNYVLLQFKMDPSHVTDLESSLRISEEVLRYLVVRLGE